MLFSFCFVFNYFDWLLGFENTSLFSNYGNCLHDSVASTWMDSLATIIYFEILCHFLMEWYILLHSPDWQSFWNWFFFHWFFSFLSNLRKRVDARTLVFLWQWQKQDAAKEMSKLPCNCLSKSSKSGQKIYHSVRKKSVNIIYILIMRNKHVICELFEKSTWKLIIFSIWLI